MCFSKTDKRFLFQVDLISFCVLQKSKLRARATLVTILIHNVKLFTVLNDI